MKVLWRWEDGDEPGYPPAHLQWQRGTFAGTDSAGWVRIVLDEGRPAVSVRPQRVFTNNDGEIVPFDMAVTS